MRSGIPFVQQVRSSWDPSCNDLCAARGHNKSSLNLEYQAKKEMRILSWSSIDWSKTEWNRLTWNSLSTVYWLRPAGIFKRDRFFRAFLTLNLIGILEARSMRCSSQAPLLTARLFVSIRLEWSSFRGIILILCLARSSWFNLKGLRAASLFVRTSRREEWISQWESWEAEPGQGVKRIESSRGLEDCPHHFSSHRRRSCELIRRRLANLYPLALLPRCLLPRMRLEREGPASLPE